MNFPIQIIIIEKKFNQILINHKMQLRLIILRDQLISKIVQTVIIIINNYSLININNILISLIIID